MSFAKANELEKKGFLVFTPAFAGELFQYGLNGFPVRSMLFDYIANLLVREPWKLMMHILDIDWIVQIDQASISLTFENFAF